MNLNKILDSINSIDVKLKASHFEFVNRNAVLYTDNAVKKGTPSWLKPYNKPQLVAHNKQGDPIGRIIDYKIIKQKTTSDEPPNYIQLIARITDKSAIEKILDGRYNTISVGSRTSKVICSECGQIITEEGLCDHIKGSYNDKGEIIHWIIDQLDYTECSFVNEPADDYANVEEINYGKGWKNYKTFLDNRINLLAEIKLEDCMSKQTDAKLSTATRKKLAESAFCGPGRSFPAHDKAHVTAGLRLLNKSNFSDSTKAKIKACLYRKGKRYGIVPSKDELTENPDLLIVGLEDEWTSDQLVELENFFKDNPDADLPDTEDSDDQVNDNTNQEPEDQNIDVQKMKNPELKDLVLKLQKDIQDMDISNKEAITVRDNKITTLEKKITDLETLNIQREDEINGYLDENAILTKKYRDSIISNILDIKIADNNEERAGLLEKYSKRQTESLLDTLNDLRINDKSMQANSENRVENTTLAQDDNSENTNSNQNNTEDTGDKFSIFNKDRSQIMED